MNTFEITINGRSYEIDVVEDGEDVEIFIERTDVDENADDDIPENELLMVSEYIVREGFVKPPKL